VNIEDEETEHREMKEGTQVGYEASMERSRDQVER
jgi:hypothetical protein